MRPVRSVQVRQTTRSLRSEPTSAGSRGGTIDPVRVGLTALYMVLMFVTVYAETSIACDDRFLVWHAAFIAYETLALCAAALWPDSGSWMVVGIWTVSTLTSIPTTFPVSAPFAVAVLGGCGLGRGLLAASVCVLSRMLSFALRIEPWPGMPGAAVLCLVFFLAAFLGALANAQYMRMRERERERMRERDQAVIDRLHDRVCNSLSFLINALEDRAASGPSGGDGLPDDEMRRILQEALRDSRAAITLVRTREDAPSGSPGHSESFTSLAETHARRLRMAGIRGDVFVDPSVDLLLDEETMRDAVSFLTELFGNIGKYADPDAGYVMSVGVHADGLHIDESNLVRAAGPDDDGLLSNGDGLRRYRRIIEARGGQLAAGADDGIWSVQSLWPLRRSTS